MGAPRPVHLAPPPVVERADPGDDDALERYAMRHPHSTIYHRPAIRTTIERACRLDTATFVARRGSGGPVAGLLPVALTRSRLFGTWATSLPYFNYGGVLADDGVDGRTLVDAAWEWARDLGARHLVLRHDLDRPGLDLPESRAKSTVLLPIPPGGRPGLWDAIGSKTRNLVRKAEKSELGYRLGDGGDLTAFHRVYTANLRDLGSPGLGLEFFEMLFAALGDAAKVHLVLERETPVAAAITLRHHERLENPWAGSLRTHRHLGANMLLYWRLLEYASAVGAREFDFGRSTPGSGPWRFKLQWGGAVPRELPWYYVTPDGRCPVGELSPSNPRFSFAIAVWKRLPVALVRRIGPSLARSLP